MKAINDLPQDCLKGTKIRYWATVLGLVPSSPQVGSCQCAPDADSSYLWKVHNCPSLKQDVYGVTETPQVHPDVFSVAALIGDARPRVFRYSHCLRSAEPVCARTLLRPSHAKRRGPVGTNVYQNMLAGTRLGKEPRKPAVARQGLSAGEAAARAAERRQSGAGSSQLTPLGRALAVAQRVRLQVVFSVGTVPTTFVCVAASSARGFASMLFWSVPLQERLR